MFTPVAQNRAPARGAMTYMAPKGMNQRDLPQLLDPSYAVLIKNYLPLGAGRLEKRGGIEKMLEIAGGYPIEMIEEFTEDLWIFGYNTTVAVYQVSTDTVTNIKTNFTASGRFRGERAGDYFIVTNGVEKPFRISRTLAYDAQTQNFTVNDRLTGQTSGATAVILEDSDSGATGTLTLGDISGTFQNNEVIQDAETTPGSATVNGTVQWTATEVTTAPIAAGVRLLDTRLHLFNLLKNKSMDAYSESDDGSNPPFTNFTKGTASDDPGEVAARNIGAVLDVAKFGPYHVVFGEKGKFAFAISQLDSGGTISKVDDFFMSRIDFGGAPGVLMTPIGLIYANEKGFHRLVNISQNNTPSGGDEAWESRLLGDKYFKGIDISNADIIYDELRGNILLTCARDSSVNNLVIGYNIESKAIFQFDWNVGQWMKSGGEIYFGSSIETKIFKAFSGSSDDGLPIGTEYIQELNLGSLYTSKFAQKCYAQGFLSSSSTLTIHFNIFNNEGEPIPNQAEFEWTAQRTNGKGDGWGKAEWGRSSWGGYTPIPGTVESFDGCKVMIRRAQRVVLRITSGDLVPHAVNWIGILAVEKGPIRRRKMTAV